ATAIRGRARGARGSAGAPSGQGAGDGGPGNGAAGRYRQHRPRAHRRPHHHGRHRRARLSLLGRDPARRRLLAGHPLPAGEDGRRHRDQRERDEGRLRQRAADAGSDHPLVGERHAPPDRRARLQADRRPGHRDLAAARGGLALRRRRQVHPRGDPHRPGQGQPGAADPRQVPVAPRPGLDAPDRTRVRGRRDPSRRADGDAARGDGHPHGGGDRALHRRARHRGPVDRDAARGDHGRRRRRQGGAAARLRRRAVGRCLRLDARRHRPAAASRSARLRPPGRAPGLRPQGQHPRLHRLPARPPHPRAHPAPAAAGGAEHRARPQRPRRDPRRRRRRARVRRGRRGDPRQGHPRGPAPAAGDQPRGPLPTDL
ncbi:MAG: DNA integrity scanning protein DisA, partial [uncultured Solirubrobacteraceae bacterium]